MYTCTSMCLNTHTSFMQGHSLTPLPFTTTTSLTTPYCAMFIELFLLEHLRCFFVTDDRQRRVFCRERRPWQSCTAGGGRTSHAFTSISVSKGSFRWRLAWRVTHDGRLWVNTTWMRVVEDNHSSSNRSLWRVPDGSSVASKGSKGHPSAPVQLRLRPSTSSLLWPLIPLLANLLIFFLPKSNSSSSRSSVLSACRSIFTKKIVPVVTRDGPAHYNVCTYFGMPIKLFLIRIWPRPPPPFSSGIRI